jgi:hypothetical protein
MSQPVNLVGDSISISISIDGTDFAIHEPSPQTQPARSSYYSKKDNNKAELVYAGSINDRDLFLREGMVGNNEPQRIIADDPSSWSIARIN